MASTATPFGAQPITRLGQSYNTQGFSSYSIASAYNTNIFFGDFVHLVTAGTLEKDGGTSAFTGTQGAIGVFVGCTYTDPVLNYKLHSQFWPANTVASDAEAYVVDDPDALFLMQASGSVPQTALGAGADIVQTAGSTNIGKSRNAVNSTLPGLAATNPLRIVDFYRGPESTVGDAFTDLIVRINVHQLRSTTGI
jgi:hypothetical protein